jgi:hypothetical protein
VAYLNETEKNELVKQYEPLINKISGQFFESVHCSWEDLKSYAYEGFAIAIQKYDETRSSMNFTQYAAFSIRNNILTSINNELRTVKMSDYNQILLEPTIDQAGMKHAESIIESFVSKALKLSESINNGDVFSFNLSKEEITEIGTLTDKVKELSLALNQLKKNGSTKSADSYLTEIGETDFLNRARKSSKTFKSDATLSKNKDMVEAEAKQARDEIARIEKERAELQKQANEEQTRLNE